MCGIAGIMGFNPDMVNDRVDELLKIHSHRGPDAADIYKHQNTFLFHNRLSIIDLDERANQPFISACGRYVIVYNGEIYNYTDLRNELISNGTILRTSSDTEVILEGYILHGISFIQRLRGMFAFAILEIASNKICLFRDRLGIKPLFFYWNNPNRLVFSSELKFIRKVVNNSLTINYNALGQYLHMGFIPEDNSIHNEIKKLQPGHFLILDSNGMEIKKFWKAEDHLAGKLITSEVECARSLEKLLFDSVNRHLISDVPVGIFLSGGVDSSLVAAMAARAQPGKISTFSLGTTVRDFNETSYARTVAGYLKTDHNEIVISHQEVINSLEHVIDLYDEPFADSSSIPTYLLSKWASAKVKVCLSGEGSDELFGGYGTYRWAKRLNNPFIDKSKSILARWLVRGSGSKFQKAYSMLNTDEFTFLPAHIFSQEQNLFSVNEIASLLNFEPWLNEMRARDEQLNNYRELSPAEHQSFFDLVNYLPDDLLVKVDRASMHHSLEVRVPFLDHQLVEYALNISPGLKIRNQAHKYILKKVLYKYLPPSMFDRPKQGFSIPLKEWLTNELEHLIDDHLNDDVIRKYNVIQRPEKVKSLVKKFKSGETRYYNRIWSLIVLHRWLDKNN